MKILFISSGNSFEGISPLVFNQGESLRGKDVQVEYFAIKGKGITGYFANILRLKKLVKVLKPDLIHAHYSLSGFLTSFAITKIPLIVSLMGSDSEMGLIYNILTRFFASTFWDRVIIKGTPMNKKLKLKNVQVIPNGVNLNKFTKTNSAEAKRKVGFDERKIIVSFFSNPNRFEKNFGLAERAFNRFNTENECEFKVIYNKPHNQIPDFLNATDIIISTSLWEGSPNIIKEAMACDVRVVATSVGDIPLLFDGASGYFQTSFELNDIIEKLHQAHNHITSARVVTGRKRIIELSIDQDSIANQLCDLYREVQSEYSN